MVYSISNSKAPIKFYFLESRLLRKKSTLRYTNLLIRRLSSSAIPQNHYAACSASTIYQTAKYSQETPRSIPVFYSSLTSMQNINYNFKNNHFFSIGCSDPDLLKNHHPHSFSPPKFLKTLISSSVLF